MGENDEFRQLEEMERYETLLDKAQRIHYKEWVRQHPQPRKPHWWIGIPWLGAPIGIIMISSMFLAASRTFPVFQGIAALTVSEPVAFAEGAMAMVAIDLAVVSLRFIQVYLNRKEQKKEMIISRMLWLGLVVATFTQATAQLYSMRGVSSIFTEIASYVEIGTALAVGLSAMALALISGEIMAVLWIGAGRAREKAWKEYEDARRAWYDRFSRSWTRSKDNYGLIISSNPVHERSRMFGNEAVYSRNSPTGRSEPTNAEWQVIKFLRENPDAANWSRKDLADAFGVAKSTASYGARWIKFRPEYLNGNGEREPDD